MGDGIKDIEEKVDALSARSGTELQRRHMSATKPTDKQVVAWNATTKKWEPLTGAQLLFCRATANLTLTITAQSIIGDGDSSKVRLILPTIGDWEVKATCDLEATVAGAGLLIGDLFVNDSATPETGQVLYSPSNVNERSTPGQRWKVTTTAVNTPVELKARKSIDGGAAVAGATHTTLAAAIGIGGGTAAASSDHGGLTGLGDDDHAQYQKESEKDAASGYAGLTAATKLNLAQMQEVMSHADLTDSPADAHHTQGIEGTLDDAYDYGGAGAGRTINVTANLPIKFVVDETYYAWEMWSTSIYETGYKWRLRSTGQLEWGPGDGTTDVVLIRVDADILGIGATDSFGANTIIERTAAAGVTVDGVLLKDGLIAASAVPDTHGVTPSAHHTQGIEGTLDDAYDYGGAGAGRQINVASGLPVSLKGDTAVVYVLQALGEGDTGYRFRVRGTGLLEWGLGDGTTDAILTRISADFLGVGPGDTFGADIIAERTAAGGVTVDGVLLKDGLIAAGAVPDTHGVTPSDHHAEAHGAAQHGAESDAAALHDNVAGEIAAITEKVTPVSTDLLVIEDSAAANAKKRVQVGNLPGGSGVTYGTPAIVLGTAAGAGAVAEAIRRDSTIVAFDITVPSTQALGDAAATGSAAVAARRDHKHAMPASPLAVGSGGTGVTALPTRPIILSALSGTPAAISVPTPRAACSWPILVVGTYEAYWVLDFDTTTIEVATWEMVMPPDYNGGTITFTPYWTTASTNTGTVIWSLSALAKGDNETLDAAAGTAQTSTDSGLGTAGKEHIGPTSAAITIAGTPAAGVTVAFVLMRDTSDTHTADARLRFIKINYTASAF